MPNARHPTRAQSTGSTASLLERAAEIDAGRRVIETALSRHGSLLLIEGAPGIGKSRLIEGLRDIAGSLGVTPLHGRGVEVHRSAPFAITRAMLTPLVGRRSGKHLDGVGRRAMRLFDAQLDTAGPSDPDAVLEALYWLLADAAEESPLVLLLDDAHWADVATLRLIRLLQPRLADLPLAAVLATRPISPDDEILGQIAADPATGVIRPAPLSEEAVGILIEQRLHAEPDSAFTAACLAATAGNPFFLSELLGELAARNLQPNAASAPGVQTVEAAAISRAVRFRHAWSADAYALARALAILGDGTGVDRLGALAALPTDRAIAAADALTRDMMVTSSPGLSFAHPIVRAAVYADIGPTERSALHAAAARLLEHTGAGVHEIASHALRIAPAGSDWVVAQLRRAATEALADGAPDATVNYLRRALLEPPAPDDRPAILYALGQAEMFSADPAGVTHLLEAFAETTDVPLRSQVALAAAFALYLAGNSSRALDMLADAAASIQDQDRDAALRIEAEIAAIAVFEPESTPARQRMDRLDEASLNGSTGERMMLAILAYRQMLRGSDARRAVSLAMRADAEDRLVQFLGGHSTAVAQCVMTLALADELDLAAALIERAHAHVLESGSRHGRSQLHYLRSVVENRAGRAATAAAAAEASLEITLPGGPTVPVAVTTAELVVARMALGDLLGAHEALRVIGMDDGDIPRGTPYITLLSARGRLRASEGQTEGALTDLLECGERKRLVGIASPVMMPWLSHAALAHNARGDQAEARRLAALEREAAASWGTAGAIGAALRTNALVGDPERMAQELAQALVVTQASPARLVHLGALLDLAAALRRGNRRSEARAHLERALEEALDLGARAVADAARAELDALGVRVSAARRDVDALTSSELRVAGFAAQGRSNREIAQSLFITTKTVEKHLGNAYAKLGVASRRDLAARLPGRQSRYPTSDRN